MNYRLFLNIAIIFLLMSCSSHRKNKLETFVYENINGKKAVISGKLINGDTIWNGLGRFYYENGRLSDQISFENNKKNGLQISYDINGNLTSKIPYKDGIENGNAFYFYPTGVIKKESVFIDGHLFFIKWFDEKGRVKIFDAINDTLHFYSMEVDSLGEKKWEKGYSFSLNPEYFSPSVDSVKVYQIFKGKIPIAAIPGYRTRIEIAKFDEKGEMLGNPDTLENHVYYSFYKTNFKVAGKYQLGIAGELRNEKNKIVKRDTMIMHIQVIN